MAHLARKHLLSTEGLSKAAILNLISRATELKDASTKPPKPLNGQVVANVFFEASTRTRTSFELAAQALGAHVLNWSSAGSSSSKGESLRDTCRNLNAMGPRIIVIRHQNSGAAEFVARNVTCSVVNAGDGQHQHPTQALLDAMTLKNHFSTLEGLHIAIVGDVLHSRVARSNLFVLSALGAKVTFCGPSSLVPKEMGLGIAEVVDDFDALCRKVDVVMMLRLQRERMNDAFIADSADYRRHFGLTLDRSRTLKTSAVVLHPGPMNRGIEIDAEVADGPQSLILDQVSNGVAMRSAVLEALS